MKRKTNPFAPTAAPTPAATAPKKTAGDAFAEMPANYKLGLGGFIFAVLAVLWVATSDSAATAATRELTKAFGIKDAAIVIGHDAETGRPTLMSSRNLQQGSAFLSIPAQEIVDQRSITEGPVGKMLQQDNATVVNDIAQENTLSQGAFNMLVHSLNFALEKRKGSASKLAAFFGIAPAPSSSILYWPEDAMSCADQAVKGELAELKRIVNATAAIAQVLCDTPEGAAAGCSAAQPVTEAELTWGLALYMQNNYQDQAFIPLLNFAKIDNSKNGFAPQFDQQKNMLHFNTNAPLAKGEFITTPYLRGPNQLIAQRGTFDEETARGVELMLQLPQDDEAVKKYCSSAIQELQFASVGRPREGLVNCMTVLVTPAGKERKRLVKNMRKYRTAELAAYTWGNLTVAVAKLAEARFTPEECAKAAQSPAVEALRAYNAWRDKTLHANGQFCEQQMMAKYAAAGLQVPTGAPPQDDIEEVQADASAENL